MDCADDSLRRARRRGALACQARGRASEKARPRRRGGASSHLHVLPRDGMGGDFNEEPREARLQVVPVRGCEVRRAQRRGRACENRFRAL